MLCRILRSDTVPHILKGTAESLCALVGCGKRHVLQLRVEIRQDHDSLVEGTIPEGIGGAFLQLRNGLCTGVRECIVESGVIAPPESRISAGGLCHGVLIRLFELDLFYL